MGPIYLYYLGTVLMRYCVPHVMRHGQNAFRSLTRDDAGSASTTPPCPIRGLRGVKWDAS